MAMHVHEMVLLHSYLLLKEGMLAERRVFIRNFVKEVKVTGGEEVLYYSMPILPEKITVEKKGFYLPYTMVGDTGLEPVTSCV